LEKLGLGKKAVTYKLRDWIFSRQRYWGEPIPMVYCQSCADKKISYFDVAGESDKLGQSEIKNSLYGWFPLEERDLPLELPYVSSYEPTETGESPLSKIESFVNTTCPNCGGSAKRETDTMPNWAGSCWYFLAFPLWSNEVQNRDFSSTSPHQGGVPKSLTQNQVFSPSSIENFDLKRISLPTKENFDFLIKNYGDLLPVDWYLGGAEHAVLHLLYSRFWVKALYDLRLLNFKEPFLRLRNVGMVLAEDNRKMSKSFGNVINPDDVVFEYGADALRLYEMFMAPFNQEIAWSTKALQGCYRFLKRVWEIYQSQYQEASSKYQEDKNLVSKLNKTIKKVTDDVSQIKFNTAIAAMMEFVNEWEKALNVKHSTLNVNEAKKFLQILTPFAPFLTEEIWREIFEEKESIHLSSWPKAEVVEDEEVVIPIQVNGKLRGTIKVKIQEIKTKSFIEQEALKDEKIKKYLEGKKYKFIYVEGKVGNFVVEVN
jgi:leucyl-tRNA synthetase